MCVLCPPEMSADCEIYLVTRDFFFTDATNFFSQLSNVPLYEVIFLSLTAGIATCVVHFTNIAILFSAIRVKLCPTVREKWHKYYPSQQNTIVEFDAERDGDGGSEGMVGDVGEREGMGLGLPMQGLEGSAGEDERKQCGVVVDVMGSSVGDGEKLCACEGSKLCTEGVGGDDEAIMRVSASVVIAAGERDEIDENVVAVTGQYAKSGLESGESGIAVNDKVEISGGNEDTQDAPRARIVSANPGGADSCLGSNQHDSGQNGENAFPPNSPSCSPGLCLHPPKSGSHSSEVGLLPPSRNDEEEEEANFPRNLLSTGHAPGTSEGDGSAARDRGAEGEEPGDLGCDVHGPSDYSLMELDCEHLGELSPLQMRQELQSRMNLCTGSREFNSPRCLWEARMMPLWSYSSLHLLDGSPQFRDRPLHLRGEVSWASCGVGPQNKSLEGQDVEITGSDHNMSLSQRRDSVGDMSPALVELRRGLAELRALEQRERKNLHERTALHSWRMGLDGLRDLEHRGDGAWGKGTALIDASEVTPTELGLGRDSDMQKELESLSHLIDAGGYGGAVTACSASREGLLVPQNSTQIAGNVGGDC